MSKFPSSIISFSTKVNGAVIDAGDINSPQDEITALETKVGKDGSADTTSLDYKVTNAASGGGGHVQTANKGGTGQTSYTKGDILAASSSSVLGKIAVGADGQALIADSTATNGVRWGGAGSISSTIAVSSVWTKPANIGANSMVFVELWGGGGSGAGAAANLEAGGGGGGGYASGWFRASVLSASVLVATGQGGASRPSSGHGQPGGNSIFDTQSSLLTAYGGGGGSPDTSNGCGGGGGGIKAQGGTANDSTPGIGGGSTYFSSVFGGEGGAGIASTISAYYGGGGGGAALTACGVVAQAIYGGGGGSGVSSSVMAARGGLSRFGGAGSKGSILGASVTSVLSGSIPGGGGGGSHGAGSSGEGGKGMVKISTFL